MTEERVEACSLRHKRTSGRGLRALLSNTAAAHTTLTTTLPTQALPARSTAINTPSPSPSHILLLLSARHPSDAHRPFLPVPRRTPQHLGPAEIYARKAQHAVPPPPPKHQTGRLFVLVELGQNGSDTVRACRRQGTSQFPSPAPAPSSSPCRLPWQRSFARRAPELSGNAVVALANLWCVAEIRKRRWRFTHLRRILDAGVENQ